MQLAIGKERCKTSKSCATAGAGTPTLSRVNRVRSIFGLVNGYSLISIQNEYWLFSESSEQGQHEVVIEQNLRVGAVQ